MTTLRVPGDKSIAHRCLLLAALGNGTSHLRGVPEGLDVRATRRALESLGVAFENTADALGVRGCGGDFVSPAGPIDCGNSGTTMRLLAGVLATRAVNARLEGDASLCARPMRRITEPLGAFGAAIGTTRDGTAPLDLTGNSAARGTDLTVAIPSAQVKSALMLAALGAKGRTTLRGALDTRDHTERLFEAFGVRAQRDANTLVVEGPATPRAIDFDVPGDISSAAFLLAAAAASPDAHLCIEDVGLNPTRTAFL